MRIGKLLRPRVLELKRMGGRGGMGKHLGPCVEREDGISSFGELLLIFCHDIPLGEDGISMEVLCLFEEGPAGGGDTLQRVAKECFIVCLKAKLSLRFQKAPIDSEEDRACEAPVFLPCLRPGVGEVQVDPADFIFRKDFREEPCIDAQKGEIRKVRPLFFGPLPPLDRLHENAVVAFDSEKIDFRMEEGEFRQKAPLSHPDLDMDRRIISEEILLPSPPKASGLLHCGVRLKDKVL